MTGRLGRNSLSLHKILDPLASAVYHSASEGAGLQDKLRWCRIQDFKLIRVKTAMQKPTMKTKRNQQAYIASVSQNGRTDSVVVISYELDRSNRFTGYEFFKIVTSLDMPRLAIPSDRQATFQEELLVLDKAVHADETPESHEDKIKEKLSEAYTSGQQITVRKIEG